MVAMRFWGVEVKGKEPCKVKLEENQILHLSQGTLSELKKGGETVTLYVKVDDKKLVLGILNPEKNPHLCFDVVFDKEFEISHNWKNGSVHVLGYMSELSDGEDYPDFSDEDGDIPIPQKENGKPAAPAAAKPAAKPNNDAKPKEEKANADDDDDDDDDSDDDDETSDDEDDSDEDMLGMSDESGEDEDDSDDEESSEDEEPAKAEVGKKRPKPAAANAKTPEPKKAKVATPQKTDGKKGGHTATPHPAKKPEKTPSANKHSPKSGAQVACGSCKKTFNSDNALQSHTKAKHSGGK